MLDQDAPELLPLLRVKCQILRRALADIPGLQLVGPIDTATPLSHLRLATDVKQVCRGRGRLQLLTRWRHVCIVLYILSLVHHRVVHHACCARCVLCTMRVVHVHYTRPRTILTAPHGHSGAARRSCCT